MTLTKAVNIPPKILINQSIRYHRKALNCLRKCQRLEEQIPSQHYIFIQAVDHFILSIESHNHGF